MKWFAMMSLTNKRRQHRARFIDKGANGIIMTPEEFDRADADELWVYELVRGVVIVSPPAAEPDADANEALGSSLRAFAEQQLRGRESLITLYGELVACGGNRRHVDRAIWAGLGRLPRPRESPTIVVDFVPWRKRNCLEDFETRRDEFLAVGIQEHWIVDRFKRRFTAFQRRGGLIRKRLCQSTQTYRTDLIPGFELRPSDLFAVSDEWPNWDNDGIT